MAFDNYQNLGEELSWDSEISEESRYSLLEEGDYAFTVTGFGRKRYNGGATMCACHMAELHLDVAGVPLTDHLYLNKKAEWRISQFFVCIGQKQQGVPCKPNWNAVPGARGRCKVGIREWTGRNGELRRSNEILAYYPPDPAGAAWGEE